ncbi:MAG: universal stress protein, partial [Thermomicrobiales bacterium]|nr:universal stress protein [Thermomicrobiales bacterium]
IGPEGEIDAEVAVKRVLAPVDSAPLSLGALPVAAAIAVANGVEAHAVHVLSPAVDDMIVPLSGMQPLPASYSDDILKAREDEGRQVVDQAADRLKMLGADAVGDLYTGRPAEALTEILHAGDVLVLASHGRKGLPRWVLGSTALRLIQNGSAPVVVVTREYLESVSSE